MNTIKIPCQACEQGEIPFSELLLLQCLPGTCTHCGTQMSLAKESATIVSSAIEKFNELQEKKPTS